MSGMNIAEQLAPPSVLRPVSRGCVVCEAPAQWAVEGERTCDAHLGDTLRDRFDNGDGFLPPLVLPVRGAR